MTSTSKKFCYLIVSLPRHSLQIKFVGACSKFIFDQKWLYYDLVSIIMCQVSSREPKICKNLADIVMRPYCKATWKLNQPERLQSAECKGCWAQDLQVTNFVYIVQFLRQPSPAQIVIVLSHLFIIFVHFGYLC